LAGGNFGCGSSREHAVWALREYGFRAIIAPSFSPIFFNNCVRNGIVPVRLPMAAVAALAEQISRDPQNNPVTVDLRGQRVLAPRMADLRFEIDPESKEMLLEGLDAIDLTMK